jgi:hypothetical protein
MAKKIKKSPYIVNAATGVVTEDKKETNDEKKYYRVMPLDLTGNGVEKLFFDNKEEYLVWQQKMINKEEKYKLLGVFNIQGLAK